MPLIFSREKELFCALAVDKPLSLGTHLEENMYDVPFHQANQSLAWQIGRLSKCKKTDQVNKKGQAYQLKMIC